MTQPNTRLTLAEESRTLILQTRRGVLASILTRDDGTPYGSVVDFIPAPNGDLIFFLSTLAQHQRNLSADHRASLTIAPSLNDDDALSRPRMTLIGDVSKVEDRSTHRDAYLNIHPSAQRYIDFNDFSFYALSVREVRFIAGFGRMGWVSGQDYYAASPDLLAQSALGAIQHMNEDHAHNLLDYTHAFTQHSDATSALMTSLDRFGFDLLVQTPTTGTTARIAFEEPITKPRALRKVMANLAQRARDVLAERSPAAS